MKISFRKNAALLLGPFLFLVMLLTGPPGDMPRPAYLVLAATVWIAIWWITEAIPIAVTSLLPLILFPLTGALDLKTTAIAFGDRIIFLYMGGFILAIGIEKWDLHKRIALLIINRIGVSPGRIILGFMLATAGLSMWISNTATAVMMMPLGMAVISQFAIGGKDKFAKALMLSIAYAASIGGIATLIGTPTNVILAGIIDQMYQVEISFAKWMLLALPISLIMLFGCWWYLTRFIFSMQEEKFPAGREEIKNQFRALGPLTYEEKALLIVFTITALAWITRAFLLTPFLPEIDDSVIALIAAIALFIIPDSSGQGRLMDWETAVGLPWGIILLFGGGLALATGFQETGLSNWIGEKLYLLHAFPLILLMLIVITVVNFLTEITSNVATASMILPILGAIALSIGIHPYALMVGACIAASCAFMLPVATPPNAVVFGSGYLNIRDMARAGFMLNIVSIILILLFTYFAMPLIWGINLGAYPEGFPR